MFGNPQGGSLFGNASVQNNATGFFNANMATASGTVVPYKAAESTDTLMKNSTNVTLNTTLHCLTAMKEYELKSIEELRWEDYQANRLTKSAGSTPFGSHTPMFTSTYSAYTPNQPTQSTLFTNTNQQSNTFGNKTIFPATNSPTTNVFGTFNSQSKPNSLFSTNTASTANKPIFGVQNTGIFGTTTSTATPTLFGSQQQQPVQTNTSFFGTNQPSNLFTNSSTSFGYQAQTANKPFSNTTNFAAPSSTSVFGAPASTSSSLFGQQNQTATPFNNALKTSLFNSGSTFPSSQSGSLFNQSAAPTASSNLFGNIQKPATSTGFPSFSGASKPLFGGNVQSNAFGIQQPSAFGNLSVPQQAFNPQTITSSTVTPTIGYNNPAEALLQQQLTQQKILSLVSNRPYGVNKLFMGQSLLSANKLTISSDSSTTNTNIMSLAIKRNDTDKFGMHQRKKILDSKTKILPNNLCKVFSGFDEEDNVSSKSTNMEKHFFTKREDWKYLPPNAFEKSRKSIISNRSINGNTTLNSNNSLINNENRFAEVTSPLSNVTQFLRDSENNKHSTPISHHGNLENNFQNAIFSPIHFGNKQLNPTTKEEVDDEKLGTSSFLLSESVLNDNKPEVEEFSVKSRSVGKKCKVTLTKEDYYTSPLIEVMDKLVTVNEDGDSECWVENFIIGRNGCGSIRFPGLTNLYGLDLDQLVDIRTKEVCVYPDDENKPEHGEGLNRDAQVILQDIYPTDKSTGYPIMEPDRLKAIHFEDKLRRVTEKMGASFLSYKPERGVWMFQVEHFSKYRYSDDEDDDDQSNVSSVDRRTDNSKDTKSPMVICAEADSMTNYPEEKKTTVTAHSKSKDGLHRFYDETRNKCIQRMKDSLYRNESDEDEYKNSAIHSTVASSYIQKEEPLAKRFQTSEIGRSIFDSNVSNSVLSTAKTLMVLGSSDVYRVIEDSRPIKPIQAEPLASTDKIVTDNQSSQSLKVPHRFRNIKSMKMPYLPLKLNRYFGLEISDVHKRFSYDAGISQGNRYRVGFHTSGIKGLKFFIKDYSNHCDESMNSFGIRHDGVVLNAVNVMKMEYEFSDYQEKLLECALNGSECLFDQDQHFPIWRPCDTNLLVLNEYVKVHSGVQEPDTFEVSVFRRIVSLCNALWADIGDKSPKEKYLKDLERKQALSMWIRTESRNELTKKVDHILNTSPKLDVEKCNDVILESLCCGEVQLACRLATLTKQHRMALLISQSAGSMQGRHMIREQLNCWSHDRTDVNIPANVMCIYVLLSGQTSAAISDGSIITPLKHLKWYQALGCYQWFIQPYIDSVKSSLDLYSEDFKTDFDVPGPFPFSDHDSPPEDEDDNYRYYDCCYHLLKFFCDSLYDMDKMLNLPTMSKSNIHRLSLDWSSSWHLANIIASLGNSITSQDKLCQEWAAQLERGGQWHWAVFVVSHVSDRRTRKEWVRSIVIRNVSSSRSFSEKENFLIQRLGMSDTLIHEAKAVRCKASNDKEQEAYHWFLSGHHDRSHNIYVQDDILSRLLLNDRLDKMSDILTLFTENQVHKSLPSWTQGGSIYLQYVSIKRTLTTLNLVNKLVNQTNLLQDGEIVSSSLGAIMGGDQDNENNIELEIKKLRTKVLRLMNSINEYKIDSDHQKVCKQQMETMCRKFLLTCDDNLEETMTMSM